jgi:TolA-binding protein
MRFTRYTPLATRLLCMISGAMLIASAPALAADKDMLSLQRDVADMTGQLSDMQKQLASVSGLSTKVDGIANDVSDLTSAVKSMQVAMNRMAQQLTDIGNQVKLIATPAPPPPGSETGSSAPGAAAAPQQPSGKTLFENAVRDQNSGNLDLAVSGFTQFLHLYPNDNPNAMLAQFNLGNIYYVQPGKLNDAVRAFNAVIEQYDSDPVTTPGAYFMKGMALKKLNRKTEAIATFDDVIKKYRTSPEAGKARSELSTLGAAPAASRKK